MRLTQEEANARLNSGQNAINIIHKQMYQGQQKSHNLKIAAPVRALIGISANNDGTREAGAAYGVSHILAGAAGRGQIVGNNKSGITQHRADSEVADIVKANLKKASSEAIERALSAMASITDAKLEKCDVKDAAAIANHMASVYDKLSNKQAAISGSGATVIIYSPREKREDEFESIDIEAHVAS